MSLEIDQCNCEQQGLVNPRTEIKRLANLDVSPNHLETFGIDPDLSWHSVEQQTATFFLGYPPEQTDLAFDHARAIVAIFKNSIFFTGVSPYSDPKRVIYTHYKRLERNIKNPKFVLAEMGVSLRPDELWQLRTFRDKDKRTLSVFAPPRIFEYSEKNPRSLHQKSTLGSWRNMHVQTKTPHAWQSNYNA